MLYSQIFENPRQIENIKTCTREGPSNTQRETNWSESRFCGGNTRRRRGQNDGNMEELAAIPLRGMDTN